MSRYYCTIRVDSNPKIDYTALREPNEKMVDVIQEWSANMMNKDIITDIGWNWSEHINL